MMPAVNVARSAVSTVIEFFVDDGVFAVAVLLWITLVAWLPHQFVIHAPWRAPVLAAGIMIALLASILRGCYKPHGH